MEADETSGCPTCGSERRALYGREYPSGKRYRRWACPRCGLTAYEEVSESAAA